MVSKRQRRSTTSSSSTRASTGTRPTVREIGARCRPRVAVDRARPPRKARAGRVRAPRPDEAASARAGRARRSAGPRERAACTLLPLIGEIAAGSPLLAEQNIEDYVAVPEPLARGDDEFLLRVRGDSMIEAGIMPGDYVVVRGSRRRRTATLSRRSLGDDESAGEATVKTFHRENGRIRLQPENASSSRCTPSTSRSWERWSASSGGYECRRPHRPPARRARGVGGARPKPATRRLR